jgi:DNA polymerase/3'-5' exonuclease PolX
MRLIKHVENTIYVKRLEELLSYKQMTDSGNKYRVRAYRNAIREISRLEFPIKRVEDLEYLEIGDRLRSKLAELVTTGHIKELDELKKDPVVKSTIELSLVHGLGPSRVQELINLGITSIVKLRSAVRHKKVILTNHQEIGLRYYKGLQEKASTIELEKYIAKFTKLLDDHKDELDLGSSKLNIKIIIVGSFSRGNKKFHNDLDIIVTSSKLKTQKSMKKIGFLQKITKVLIKYGFIVDLISSGSTKTMGIILDPKIGKYAHHLDVYAIPYNNIQLGEMYLSSGGMFNIYMASLLKKRGFTYGLNGVYHTETKTKVRIASDKAVFKLARIGFIPKNERQL